MASIKEAFDSTVKEAFGGIKVCIWAVPVCICANLIKSNSDLSWMLSIIVGVLLFGYLTESEHNVVIKTGKLLPGINVLQFGLIGLLALLVLTPFIFFGWGVWYLVDAYVKIPSPTWDLTVRVLGAFLAISFPLAAHLLLIRRLNPFDAFNIKKYFIGFGETFFSFSFLVVKLGILAALVIGFVAYMFTMLIGIDNIIWLYFISAYIVMTLFITANYMAQVSEEIYVFMEKDENKKREQEAIEKLR